jgi:hypothetical protein
VSLNPDWKVLFQNIEQELTEKDWNKESILPNGNRLISGKFRNLLTEKMFIQH